MFFFNVTATTEIYTLSLPRRSSDLSLEGLRDHMGGKVMFGIRPEALTDPEGADRTGLCCQRGFGMRVEKVVSRDPAISMTADSPLGFQKGEGDDGAPLGAVRRSEPPATPGIGGGEQVSMRGRPSLSCRCRVRRSIAARRAGRGSSGARSRVIHHMATRLFPWRIASRCS